MALQILWRAPLSLEEYVALGKAVEFPIPGECPACRKKVNLKRHGWYQRYAVRQDIEVRVWIPRLLCTACGRTISMLPSFFIPRFQPTAGPPGQRGGPGEVHSRGRSKDSQRTVLRTDRVQSQDHRLVYLQVHAGRLRRPKATPALGQRRGQEDPQRCERASDPAAGGKARRAGNGVLRTPRGTRNPQA